MHGGIPVFQVSRYASYSLLKKKKTEAVIDFMPSMTRNELLEELVERGIDKEHIDIVRHSGIDLEKWLGGFESVEKSVEETVHALKTHPLMPKDIEIKGFIMDSETGELTEV